MHDDNDTAENVNLDGLLQRLSTARDAFGVLAELTDEQLDSAPPAGSFRFCDGHRTLEQVVAGLLKHQTHQIDAMKAAVARGTAAPVLFERTRLPRGRRFG
jgi:hypothetical protein